MTWMHAGMAYASHSQDKSLERAQHWVRQAVALDPWDADALAILAWIIHATRGVSQECFDGVCAHWRSTPTRPGHMLHTARCCYSADVSWRRDRVGAALRLDPSGPISVMPLTQVAMSYYLEGDYPEAADAARRAAFRYPKMPLGYRTLAAALGQLGRMEEARAALPAAIDISPQGFALYVVRRPPWFRPADYEHLLEGIRRAGWQG